jgi:hypothetical protein
MTSPAETALTLVVVKAVTIVGSALASVFLLLCSEQKSCDPGSAPAQTRHRTIRVLDATRVRS